MSIDGDGTRRVTPRLPDAGWLPDPASYDIERFWDGSAWTKRIRDRATGHENGLRSLTFNPVTYMPGKHALDGGPLDPLPLDAMPPESDSGHQPTRADRAPWLVHPSPHRRHTKALRWLVFVVALCAFVLPPLGRAGYLPEWVPGGRIPSNAMLFTNPPAVLPAGYTAFGSDDDVKFLATQLIADSLSIDVTSMIGADGDTAAVEDAMLEAMQQNPYVFVGSYVIDVKTYGTFVQPRYIYGAVESERRRALLKEALALAVSNSGAVEAVGDRDKARKVHDFVIANAVYDSDAYDQINAGVTVQDSREVAASQEAYGVFLDGTAVCNGYAAAYLLLAEAVGLHAVIVTGDVSSGVTTGPHAWNKVRVDGEWLNVDTTWDDDGATILTTYFLLPDGAPELDTRVADLEWVVDANVKVYGA